MEGEKGDDFAGKIIRWGFEWAFLNNLTIIPTSKHVMEFIKKSPHFIKFCTLTEELIKMQKEAVKKETSFKKIEVIDDKSYKIALQADQIVMMKDGLQASLINLKMNEKSVEFLYVITRSKF